MGVQPTANFGYIQTSGIKISQDILRSILHQIETELLESETYHLNLEQLENLVGESSEIAHKLVKNISREAIRLTFRQIAKHYKFAPVTDSQPEQQSNPNSETQRLEINDPDSVIDLDDLSDLAKRPLGLTIASKRLSKAQQAEIFKEEWGKSLKQIGSFLKQTRQQQGISLDQLHSNTLVPIYQITALEEGQIDKLPEDIYVRGFIRRIAKALKLDEKAILAYLPQPDNSAIPSWYRSNLSSNSNVPIPLYLGYTALVAGAVGGLSLTINQSQPASLMETESPSLETEVSLSSKFTQDNVKPSNDASTNIVPPETLEN